MLITIIVGRKGTRISELFSNITKPLISFIIVYEKDIPPENPIIRGNIQRILRVCHG